MATVTTEEIPGLGPNIALASVACAENETLTLGQVGELLGQVDLRWARFERAVAAWEYFRGKVLPAFVVVTDCPDLKRGVSSAILGFAQTKQHSHSLVHHHDIEKYHWPHDLVTRKYLVELA
jgi:hypothetical protein